MTIKESLARRRKIKAEEAALKDILGPTADEIMAQEFGPEDIAQIEASAKEKAERMRAFARAEAAAKSASVGVLRKIRDKAGMSQKSMAEILEVSQPAISKMEKSDPQLSSILLYAEALGADVSLSFETNEGKVSIPFALSPLKKTPTSRRKRSME